MSAFYIVSYPITTIYYYPSCLVMTYLYLTLHMFLPRSNERMVFTLSYPITTIFTLHVYSLLPFMFIHYYPSCLFMSYLYLTLHMFLLRSNERTVLLCPIQSQPYYFTTLHVYSLLPFMFIHDLLVLDIAHVLA